MKKFWLFVWQILQNIIGFIITRFACGKICYNINNTFCNVYFVKHLFKSGVSLGNYIIFDQIYCEYRESDKFNKRLIFENSVRHEHGHQIQSQRFGPFYFIVVGIPSLFRNIYHRIFHKNWSSLRKSNWYYGSYPEKQADQLGCVLRNITNI